MYYTSPSSYCTIPPGAFQAVRDFVEKYKAADADEKDRMLDELSEKIRAKEAQRKAREQATHTNRSRGFSGGWTY